MKLIVEDYPYASQDVAGILTDFHPLEKDGMIRMKYVGYFYSQTINDCIFFLPKVVVDENDNVLGKNCKPSDIIDLEKARSSGTIKGNDYTFLSNLSVWIYRVINVFRKNNPDSQITLRKTYSVLDSTGKQVDSTYLDTLLSLIKFNNENREFFMFIIKNIHSGYNKINWNKTIARKTAFLDDDDIPTYVEVVNKKKQINFDEELLVIYFSALQFISMKFGFKTNIDCNYDLITGEKFEHYLRGYGVIRLRQIKYKYFSDKALELWRLCNAFFEKSSYIKSSSQESDYLLVKDFNIVFEDIIDNLIGDPKESLPKDLKEQKDGKIIDHIYEYESLMTPDNIYYIGDSKYYKIGHNVSGESVYKQFTYAKNVIQTNLNLLLDENFHDQGAKYLEYRDDLTEGYNITPNFFISAMIDDDREFSKDELNLRGVKGQMSRQFENRLFDRDTLWISHYDVNFLYVISLYAGENSYAKNGFKEKARKLFREKMQLAISSNYLFKILVVAPETNLTTYEAVNINFRNLLGRIFRPFNDRNKLLLALYRPDTEYNEMLIKSLKRYFILADYCIGDNPDEVVGIAKSSRSGVSDFIVKDTSKTLLCEPQLEGYGRHH